MVANTAAGARYGKDDYLSAGCGFGRRATLWLTERGVRVVGTDAWSWDAPFVLVAECFNVATGVGSRFGSELLKAGFKGRYNHIGSHKEGAGGLWQQMGFQGLDPDGIMKSVKALL